MKIEVQLRCDHLLYFSNTPTPTTGDRVWCTSCDSMSYVLGRTGAYHAVCTGCTFDEVRDGQTAIRRNLQKHLARYPEHVLVLAIIGAPRDQCWRVAKATPIEATEPLF